jgi:hypothetical protein
VRRFMLMGEERARERAIDINARWYREK